LLGSRGGALAQASGGLLVDPQSGESFPRPWKWLGRGSSSWRQSAGERGAPNQALQRTAAHRFFLLLGSPSRRR